MAVYTDVTADDLDTFLAKFDVGEALTFKGIAEGVSNSNYLLRTDKSSFILTLYEKMVEEEDLPYYLGLMEHVAAKGFPSATAVADKNGETLHVLNGKPAALISFLDGISVRRVEPSHCALAGEALAKFHEAASDFPMHRQNDRSIDGWRAEFERVCDRADEVREGLADLIAEELDYLAECWPEDLPHGVIHADMFPDNVFFLRAKFSGLIDFYFACNDALAYDLAICLNAWCFESAGDLNVTKAQRLIGAYDAARPLTEAEKSAFPILARGATLRFLTTRLYDWLYPAEDALVRAKNPLDYVKRLEFHRHAKTLADYRG